MSDNQALHAALAHSRYVLPVFVLDPALWNSGYAGDKRRAFLLGGLRALDANLRDIAWDNDPDAFAAWQAGRTGYPIVDAGMRQLLETGWMHNRARMLVASFLTKHLLIDWRWGERHFMQQLIDGDPASNNGGWQWVAGVGTDAAPYFRIFNPVLQAEKYDPHGEYVRRWVAELEHVPAAYLHKPWTMPADVQHRAGCVIGKDYPAPIVEHAWARQQALAVYKAARTAYNDAQ